MFQGEILYVFIEFRLHRLVFKGFFRGILI